jgi:hypothetical protein
MFATRPSAAAASFSRQMYSGPRIESRLRPLRSWCSMGATTRSFTGFMRGSSITALTVSVRTRRAGRRFPIDTP